MAGIIQQIAPAADIRMYRAIDSEGIGSELAVAREMIQAVKDGAEILNLSLGCQTQDNIPPIAIRAALEVIGGLKRGQDREVLIVAAAGNYGDSTPCWPGAFSRVVSMAGLAPDMLPTAWSSYGSWVTCSTVGPGLRSTYVEGRESSAVDPDPQTFGRGLLGSVERYLIRRAPGHGISRPAASAVPVSAPRGAAQAAGGRPPDTGLRTGNPDIPGI